MTRLAWLTLPFTAGTLVNDGVVGRSTPVQALAVAACWVAWGAVLVALLVRRPLGLTVLRCVAPLAVVGALWGSAVSDRASAPLAAALTLLAAVPVALAFLPEIGAWMVNGAAYGDERRYPLRAAGAVLAGPLWLSWLALVAGGLAGPLLLASRQWIAGGLAVLVGVPAVVVTARALHSLSLRWAVLVPAGLVLKDHVTMLDPMLFARPDIQALGPAPVDTDALDLTARSPGLAVELRLREATPLGVIAGRESQTVTTSRLLFTPTRPGALLADAASRRIPVHTAMPPPSTSSSR
jgi:hypothetical protein